MGSRGYKMKNKREGGRGGEKRGIKGGMEEGGRGGEHEYE